MMNNVLLIEDCEKTRTLFKEILITRRLAKNIVEADNGVHGLRKAKNQKFDLIISDNQMPKYSGIDLSIDLINLKKYQDLFPKWKSLN